MKVTGRQNSPSFFGRRTEQYAPWVRALDMEPVWQLMSPQSRRDAMVKKLPNLQLEVRLPPGPVSQPKMVSEVLQQRLLEQRMTVNSVQVPAIEAFSIPGPLAASLRAAGKRVGSRLGADMVARLDALPATVEEILGDAIRVMAAGVEQSMISRIRADRMLVRLGLEQQTSESDKLQLRLIVECVQPERRTFMVGDQKRDAYRLAKCVSWDAVRWATCTAKQLGITSDAVYPVYVQSHALDRVEERLMIGRMEPEEPACAMLLAAFHSFAFAAVQNPRIARIRDGELLFEYRFGEHRLGYLLAEIAEEAVLIRTFLFLTMQGTPEAELLYGKRRLARRDIEWLRMDDFRTFVESDLKDDPEIERLFVECGCASLLEFARAGDLPYRDQVATEYRKYLRLDERNRRPSIGSGPVTRPAQAG